MIIDEIRYIDLYAGIGGFRVGLRNSSDKFKCIWSCEKDKYARQVYKKHFGKIEAKDIRKVDKESIPRHNLLCAGFPCQSFSLAGERKGFEDTRGTLFHEIAEILRSKSPEYFLLENVKGLLSTQNRNAFRIVLESLDRCGYNVSWQVLNSKNFGVPQNRPRVFIIGHLRAEGGNPQEILPVTGSQKEYNGTQEETQEEGAWIRGKISGTIDKNYWKSGGSRTHIKETREPNINKQIIKTNFPDNYRTYDNYFPSLTRITGGGHLPKIIEETQPEWLLPASQRKIPYMGSAPKLKHIDEEVSFPLQTSGVYTLANLEGKTVREKELNNEEGLYDDYTEIRKITPTECERLQGFPDGWTNKGIDKEGDEIEISDTQRYKQLGNAVTTKVIKFIGNRFVQNT